MNKSGAKNKLTYEQRKEIAVRFVAGETQKALAMEFGVCVESIQKVCRYERAVRPSAKKIADAVKEKKKVTSVGATEFEKRANSVLWRQDKGTVSEHVQYSRFKQRVAELESKDDGDKMTHNQAVVCAAKEFPCLHSLFRDHDVSMYDVDTGSGLEIKPYVATPKTKSVAAPKSEVVVQNKPLEYKENLAWAMEAAGEYWRTKKDPATVPNNTAFFLYSLALEQPKDFLARVGQAEARGNQESEAKIRAKRCGKKSIEEIEAMLDELDLPATDAQEEHDDSQTKSNEIPEDKEGQENKESQQET